MEHRLPLLPLRLAAWSIGKLLFRLPLPSILQSSNPSRRMNRRCRNHTSSSLSPAPGKTRPQSRRRHGWRNRAPDESRSRTRPFRDSDALLVRHVADGQRPAVVGARARLLCSSSTETPARTRQVSSGTRRKWRSGKQRTAALPGAQQSKFTQPVLAKLGVADMDGAAELRARGRADKPNPFQRRSHIGIPRMKENQARNVWHLLLSGIKPGRDSRVRSAGANARHPDDRTRGRNARRSGAAAGAVEGASCAV